MPGFFILPIVSNRFFWPLEGRIIPIMTISKEPPAHSLSPEELASVINAFTTDRRDNHEVRPVYLQPLNTFAPPNVAVLTHEDSQSVTIASIPLDAPDGLVVIYDDEAPQGSRSLLGTIEHVRAANRCSDHARNMCLIYILKREDSSEGTDPPNISENTRMNSDSD
ncbi:MAG: hypothetical protein PF483_16665 [Halothiobacillus sp.]|nr:hypothetical protein [Halothiobacillus sp.]